MSEKISHVKFVDKPSAPYDWAKEPDADLAEVYKFPPRLSDSYSNLPSFPTNESPAQLLDVTPLIETSSCLRKIGRSLLSHLSH